MLVRNEARSRKNSQWQSLVQLCCVSLFVSLDRSHGHVTSHRAAVFVPTPRKGHKVLRWFDRRYQEGLIREGV